MAHLSQAANGTGPAGATDARAITDSPRDRHLTLPLESSSDELAEVTGPRRRAEESRQHNAIGAEGGTRTPTGCPTRPSNVRVCQFRHFGASEVEVCRGLAELVNPTTVAKLRGRRADVDQRPTRIMRPIRDWRSRGSRASRMPSPRRLYESTVIRIASPG